jgi:CRISPR-associated protein Cas1
LSLGYTLLNQTIYSLLQTVGLHSHLGNLHIHHDHHPALVADFMGEFRAQLVDSLVLNLMIFQIFTPEDFTQPDEQGKVYLYPDALQKFIKYWEKELHSEVTHLHAGTVTYQQCLEWQVREYISCLLGDQAMYRPFISKT